MAVANGNRHSVTFSLSTIPDVNCFRTFYLQGDLQPTGCPREPRQVLRGQSSGLKKVGGESQGAQHEGEDEGDRGEGQKPRRHQGHTDL